MSKGEKRSGPDATVEGPSKNLLGFPSMPKGEIVGMFYRKECGCH